MVGNGEVVLWQLFGDFIFEGGFYFFLEGSIVSFEHLEKISMGEIRYDGVFFVRDGNSNIGCGRMDIACFFYVFPFLLPIAGKASILSIS